MQWGGGHVVGGGVEWGVGGAGDGGIFLEVTKY